MSDPTTHDRSHQPQYPRDDDKSELEDESRKAIEATFPLDRFRWRDEPGKDRGVDAELELKADGCSLNLRAKLQIKGTVRATPNGDGSLSVPVATRNLNYLLNGPSPIYLLYVRSTHEIYFAWAFDEKRRLDIDNPNWQEQAEVTIRCSHKLSLEGVNSIYERIEREGQSRRDTTEILNRAFLQDGVKQVAITFDVDTLAVFDPDKAQSALTQLGMSMVASGQVADVLKIFDHLSVAATRTAQIQTVRAYAMTTLGSYQAASASITEAYLLIADGSPLSPRNRAHLAYLRCECAYQLGTWDLDQYARAIASLGKENGVEGRTLALSYRLQNLRDRYLRSREDIDPSSTEAILGQVRELTAQIISDPEYSDSFRLQARLIDLYVEGAEAATRFNEDMLLVAMAGALHRENSPDLRTQMVKRIADWDSAASEAVEAAHILQNPLLHADAIAMRLMFRVIHLHHLFQIVDTIPEGAALFSEIPHDVLDDATVATAMYHRIGSIAGELDVTLRLADLYEITGQPEVACELAARVAPRALAMGYTRIAYRAIDHMEGTTAFSRAKAMRGAAPDEVLVAQSDQEVQKIAALIIKALNLPSDCHPLAEAEVRSYRRLAWERLHWCRHFQLLRNAKEQLDPQIHYARERSQKCGCSFTKKQSSFSGKDAEILMTNFKTSSCLNCVYRSPKRPLDPPPQLVLLGRGIVRRRSMSKANG